MEPYQYLSSPNGRYRFMVQGDGSALVRDMHYNTDLFNAMKALPGQCWFPKCKFHFNQDGRLQQRDQYGVPHWTTETPDQRGFAAFRLTIQNNGNLVMYDLQNRWMWQSKTFDHLGALNMIAYGRGLGNRLDKGKNLYMGQYLESPNADWIFLGEPQSGNFAVFFKYGTQHQQKFFHTGNNGQGTKFAFLKNGNLETTARNNNFRTDHDWSAHTITSTSGGPKVLELDNTGNLILYSEDGPWLWGACAHGPCQNNCDQNGDGVDDGSCAGTKNF